MSFGHRAPMQAFFRSLFSPLKESEFAALETGPLPHFPDLKQTHCLTS
jgi:hypothetical protein